MKNVPVPRGYRQACGIAHGLDLVGERWALLIVRELLLGPKRFTDLRGGLPGASPNALTDRLHELSQAGVVRHRRLPPPAASWVYELTDWGRELEPILLDLGTWAVRSATLDERAYASLDSVMLTIRTYFRGGGGAPATVLVRLIDGNAEHSFGVRLDATKVEVSHEPPDHPDATITTDKGTLLSVLDEHARLESALGTTMTIDGDAEVARGLIEGVVMPETAPIEARR